MKFYHSNTKVIKIFPKSLMNEVAVTRTPGGQFKEQEACPGASAWSWFAVKPANLTDCAQGSSKVKAEMRVCRLQSAAPRPPPGSVSRLFLSVYSLVSTKHSHLCSCLLPGYLAHGCPYTSHPTSHLAPLTASFQVRTWGQ